VLLFGKELIPFAPLEEVFGVSHGREPVETRSICLTNQVGGSYMAATLTTLNLSQEVETFWPQDALH
jgi:hypothetical protein